MSLDFLYQKVTRMKTLDPRLSRLPEDMQEFVLASEFIRTLPTAFEYLKDFERVDRMSARIYLVISTMGIEDADVLFEEPLFCFFEKMLRSPSPSILFDVLFALSNFALLEPVREVLVLDSFFAQFLKILREER